jgi:hypothetical protein
MEMEGRISKAAAWKWEIICIPLTNYFTSFTFTATFPCGWLEGGGGGYTFHVVDSLLSGRLHGIEERTLSGKRRDKKMPINK